jgi:hypothetical protein
MSLHLSESNLCDPCYTDVIGGLIPSLVLLPRDTLTNIMAFMKLHLVCSVFITFVFVILLCTKRMELMHNGEAVSFVDTFHFQNHSADFDILYWRFRLKVFKQISFWSISVH